MSRRNLAWRLTCTELNPNHMLRATTISPSQSATIADIQHQSEPTTESLFQSGTRTVLGHAILCVGVLLLYLLLNRPDVILLSRLGLTAWCPAVLLSFSIMLAICPSYVL